jgi:hypothetical protein
MVPLGSPEQYRNAKDLKIKNLYSLNIKMIAILCYGVNKLQQ